MSVTSTPTTGITVRRNLLAAPAVSSARVDVYSGVARLAATVWASEVIAEGTSPDTAVMMVHPTSNMLGHYALVPLAERGYAGIGLTTRYVGNDSSLITENVLLDIAAMVRYLREERGYRRIVLVGNSGGASVVPYYQAQARQATVTDPPGGAADTVLSRLADSLKTVLQQRKQVANEVEEILDAHPLAGVLTSMPGIGVRTAARILLEIGDASSFASSAHLAAYAGIAPITRTSGSSIKGEHPARTGNRKLKRAFFLAAFAALNDPVSRAYYDKKRAEGKKHNAALICLARRRCDVLYAMLRNKTYYRHPEPNNTPAAA